MSRRACANWTPDNRGRLMPMRSSASPRPDALNWRRSKPASLEVCGQLGLAEADLADIWVEIATDDIDTADQFIQALRSRSGKHRGAETGRVGDDAKLWRAAR